MPLKRTLILAVGLLTPFLSLAETSADFIQKNSIPVDGFTVPAEIFPAGAKILFVGEMHGTMEEPAVTGRILREAARLGPVALGLEYPADLQPVVDSFLFSGDEAVLRSHSFFADSLYHSGRASHAMIELLREAGKIDGVSVFCFDIPFSTFPPDRDTEMARNVFAYWQGHGKPRMILLSGNIHSRVRPGYPGNPIFASMASEVLRLSQGELSLNNVASLLFRFDHGSAWNCLMRDGKIDCGVHEIQSSGGIYSTAVDYAAYFLREPEVTDGHQAAFFLREVSASLPHWK